MRGLIILGAIYDFYSRPCGRGDRSRPPAGQGGSYFYSRPCGRGDQRRPCRQTVRTGFLLTPLREGRRMESSTFPSPSRNFYSRPCGRGDLEQEGVTMEMKIISTHAPAGGATSLACSWSMSIILFLLTPLREGIRGQFFCFHRHSPSIRPDNPAVSFLFSLISGHLSACDKKNSSKFPLFNKIFSVLLLFVPDCKGKENVL